MSISKEFFKDHAHRSYIEGLDKTGISMKHIPKISDMDDKLSEIGWRAVPVRGFLPPTIFMQFQSHGILPIASDMRDVSHMTYTPAPDIVHEAAGHSPIIVDQSYSDYLNQYGEIASKVIFSKQDHDIYMAIRLLSDLKENPNSSSEEVRDAEDNLRTAVNNNTHLSEAAYLSRLNWWTVEYGLVGDINSPKIYGAGLLSSVGESYNAIFGDTKKIPLSLDCINYSYDITEQQPQLFVARDFNHLSDVLDEFSKTLSYCIGGMESIVRAIKSESVCTFKLDSGLQVSGVPVEVVGEKKPIFYRFNGPVQLSIDDKQISGHGGDYHSHGFSSPLCSLDNISQLNDTLEEEKIEITFNNDIHLSGKIKNKISHNSRLILVSFTNCNIFLGDRQLFDSSWGDFDLACGQTVESVYGGAADFTSYLPFMDLELPNKEKPRYLTQAAQKQSKLILLYEKLDSMKKNLDCIDLNDIYKEVRSLYPDEWLLLFYILKEAHLKGDYDLYSKIELDLITISKKNKDLLNSIKRGLNLTADK